MKKSFELITLLFFLQSFFLIAEATPVYDSVSVRVFTTAKGTDLRLTPEKDAVFGDGVTIAESKAFIFLDDTHTFQTMLGIGGAITDASAEVFAKLPASSKEELLRAYYDPVNGIGYTLARTNIQSCDFSSESYSYVQENDRDLKSFSVKHDEQYRIPLIKAAIARANHLTLYASPWSPPAWMKSNHNMLHGGKLLPEYYQSWANFYIKFIEAYQEHGIPVWGISVQNEPMAVQTWESCVYTAEEERDFIKNYLGPTLAKSAVRDRKLIAWDHNRDLIYNRASTILNDPDAAKYVWGIGYHWYETWTGGPMQFDNVRKVHETFPDKNLIFTEGTAESFNIDSLNSWSLGEKYGNSMIHDFNNGTVGWTDWNILLDEKGGPNHVGNFCFAPVHVLNNGKLFYTNSFYYIGHFSKFIHPGAVRINASSNRTALITTAFRNTDGSIVVVVMNGGEKPLEYNLYYHHKSAVFTSRPHSISTLTFKSFD